MEMADRIAVMGEGRIVQCDEPAALLRDPATPFVAGFIGDATGLPCTVSGGTARFGALPLPPVRLDLPDGAATVFVRAADVLATPGGPALHGLATVRAVRHDVAGPPQVVAEAGGITLEATCEEGRTLPRNAPCGLSLLGGHAFGAGLRATVTPRRAATPAEPRLVPSAPD